MCKSRANAAPRTRRRGPYRRGTAPGPIRSPTAAAACVLPDQANDMLWWPIVAARLKPNLVLCVFGVASKLDAGRLTPLSRAPTALGGPDRSSGPRCEVRLGGPGLDPALDIAPPGRLSNLHRKNSSRPSAAPSQAPQQAAVSPASEREASRSDATEVIVAAFKDSLPSH
jgi:hypothetical protein